MIRDEAIDLARSIVEAIEKGRPLTFGDKDKTFAEVCSVLLEEARVCELRGSEVARWAHESGTAKGQRDRIGALLVEACDMVMEIANELSDENPSWMERHYPRLLRRLERIRTEAGPPERESK